MKWGDAPSVSEKKTLVGLVQRHAANGVTYPLCHFEALAHAAKDCEPHVHGPERRLDGT